MTQPKENWDYLHEMTTKAIGELTIDRNNSTNILLLAQTITDRNQFNLPAEFLDRATRIRDLGTKVQVPGLTPEETDELCAQLVAAFELACRRVPELNLDPDPDQPGQFVV